MKVFWLFDEYGNIYQPYLRYIAEELAKVDGINLTISAYKNSVESAKVKCLLKGKKRAMADILCRRLGYGNYLHWACRNADVVHVQHSYLFPQVLPLIGDKSKNPKVVITLRGGDTYVKPWYIERWASFYKDFGCKVDSFIVQSEHQKEYLSTRWEVPSERIVVNPISFPESHFGDPLDWKPKSLAEEVVFVSVFRMTWEKNLLNTFQLLKSLRDEGLRFKYYLIGNGPDIGQAYYLKDRLGLFDEVVITGYLSHTDIFAILKEAHFIIQLSISEALPASILEAQSIGVVPIVSVSGGLPKAVNFGAHGIIGDCFFINSIKEEILRLVADCNRYKKCSAAARQYVLEKFSLKRERDNLVLLYKQIVSN